MMGSNALQVLVARLLALLVVVDLTALISAEAQTQAHTPGLVHTESGYDTVNGKDAICWFAPPFLNLTTIEDVGDNFGGLKWGGFLVPSFIAGPTQMMSSCRPLGMDIHLDQTSPLDKRLRQGESESYHLFASVNLTRLRSAYGLAEDSFFYTSEDSFFHSPDGPQVSFQLTFCPLNGNLCSPFSRKKPRTPTRHLVVEAEEEAEPWIYLKRLQVLSRDHSTVQDWTTSVRNMQNRRDLQITLTEVGSNLTTTRHKGDDFSKPKSYLAGGPMLVPVPTNDTDLMDYAEFHLDFDIAFPYSGSYLPLATMQFFLDNGTTTDNERDNSTLLKFDMANLLHQRTQVFYEPMKILEVSDGVAILTYVLVAIFAAIELALMASAIYYRNEGVIKLSQGGFLIFLLACGTMVCCCSVLFNPVSDLACYLQGPMVRIPLQLMLATVYGRLRRIYIIMAPLLNWGGHNTYKTTNKQTKQGLKNWKRVFMTESTAPSSMGTSSIALSGASQSSQQEGAAEQRTTPRRRLMMRWRQRSIRQTYSATRLWYVIGILTTPVIVLEIIGITVFTPDLHLETNEDESVGRYECGTFLGSANHQGIEIASIAVIVVTIFLAMYEANRSRNLPALFNEADSVSTALTASLFAYCVGFAVVFLTDDPEANPGIPYLFHVITVCFIAVNLSVRLMLPKLQLIWKGEKVVLSRMLAEHKQQSSGRVVNTTAGPSIPNGTYATPTPTPTPLPSGTSLSQTDHAQSHHEHDRTEQPDVPTGEETKTEMAKDEAADGGTEAASGDETPPVDETPQEDESVHVKIEQTAVDTDEHRKSQKPKRRQSIVIESGHQPPSKLVMQVLQHSNTTSRINQRILSGLQVSREDWDELKRSGEELQELLANAEFQ